MNLGNWYKEVHYTILSTSEICLKFSIIKSWILVCIIKVHAKKINKSTCMYFIKIHLKYVFFLFKKFIL